MIESDSASASSGGVARSLLALMALAAATVALAYWGNRSGGRSPVDEKTAAETAIADKGGEKAPVKPAAAPSAASEARRLIGRWQRLDNPSFSILIRSVAADGKLDASYANPNPINVSRAESHTSDGRLRVFVELRDVNYPGATYNLTYEPGTDQLSGEYNQPLMGEVYQIAFARAAE